MEQNLHALRPHVASCFSDGMARVTCYLLGPLTALIMLQWRNSGHLWAVRFHAFHSILMTGLWALSWGVLRGVEAISPWFLGTVARQTRLATNLGFGLIWILLLITAYSGTRMAVVPFLHTWAVRLARRYDQQLAPGLQ